MARTLFKLRIGGRIPLGRSLTIEFYTLCWWWPHSCVLTPSLMYCHGLSPYQPPECWTKSLRLEWLGLCARIDYSPPWTPIDWEAEEVRIKAKSKAIWDAHAEAVRERDALLQQGGGI